MKKLIALTIALLLAGVGCGPVPATPTPPPQTQPAADTTITQPPEQAETTTTVDTPASQTESAAVAPPASGTVKIFFVALNDNGAAGKMIGCGDSVVGVEQAIDPPGTDPLVAALSALLKQKSDYYGGSGLYNSLSASNLQIKKISAVKGVYTVEFTGTMSLGGACDDPRFYNQIMETIQQFPEVKHAEVLINDKKLEDIVSEKG